MSSRRSFPILILLGIILFLGGCRRTSFKPMSPEEEALVAQVVDWSTEGAVGPRGPVEIVFKQDWAADDEIGKPVPSGWLRIDPGIGAKAIWKDHRTLRLDPAENLDPKKIYQARLDLNALTGRKDLPEYRFWFASAPRTVEWEPQGFAKAADESWTLSLRVKFSSLPSGDSSRWFRADQSLGNPKLRWIGSGAQDGSGVLEIGGLKRNGQPLDLVFDGKGAELVQDEQAHFNIPSGDQPEILSARPWTGEDREGFEVFLSDAPAPMERLDGFVKVQGHKIQLNLSGNVMRATFEPQHSAATLVLAQGLPFQNGKILASESVTTHQFVDLKPHVEWEGSGIILPTKGSNQLHFSAMNLGQVRVEVRRIRVQNVAEHIMVRGLDEEPNSWGSRNLGEVIWDRTIQLGARKNASFAGTLDLGAFLQGEPGLYSVKLTGVRQGMLFSCADRPRSAPMVIGEAKSAEEGESSEESAGYDDDSEGDYNWKDRQNPCKGAFWRYGDNQSVTRNVMVSDLGLIASQDKAGRLQISTHDLVTTDPWSRVEVEVLAKNDRILSQGSTDGDGFLELTGTSSAAIVHAKAERGGLEHHAWLRISDGHARNISQFAVDGEASAEGIRIFLYGERGVWRPGDSIYLGAVVRGPDHQAIERLPLKWILRDPRGKIVQTSVQRAAVDGHFGWRIATRPEDPTGRWNVTAEAGPASQGMGVQVETVRPNRLKIEIPATEIGADKDVELKSHWLSGGSAAGLAVKVEASFAPRPFEPAGFEGFSFTNPNEDEVPGDETVAFEGSLDASGSARFRVQPSSIGRRDPMTVNLRSRVFEEGGQSSVDRVSLPYWPASRYTGVRIKTQWGARDRPIKVELASVDRSGKAVSGQNLHVEIYTNGKYWWWETGERFRNFLSRSATRQVGNLHGKSGETVSFTPDSVGQYLVIVTDEQTGHSAGADVYVSADGQPVPMEQGESSPAKLTLKAAKDSVKPGDRIEVAFQGAPQGRALVQLMRGRSILSYEWVKTKGEVVHWSTKATAEMVPGVYVQVTQLQKWPPSTDRPLRMWAIAPIAVIDPASRLHPRVSLPSVLRPEAKVKVHLSEADRRPMRAMLMVVDEGLLDLTRFRTPNPWKTFHGKEALEVATWDLHDEVIGGWDGRSDRLFAIGGDGLDAAARKNGAKANPFRPMVRVLGPFDVPKGGMDVELDVPRYTGSVRAMVVASAKEAFGSVDSTVQVKSPVMALLTVPRGMSPGDRADIPVTVFSEKAGTVKVGLSLDGPASIEGPASKTLAFAAAGDQVVTFSVKAAGRTGQVGVHAVAESPMGSAKVDEPLEVRTPGEPRALVQWAAPVTGQIWSSPLEAYGAEGTRKTRLEFSSVGLVGLENRLDELIRYPHGCLEQTISAALPQVFLADLMPWMGKDRLAAASTNVDIALDKLQRFQLPSGAFSLWQGEAQPYEWGTIWAGRFLLAAKAGGHAIPGAMWDSYLRHLSDAVSRWSPGAYSHDRGDTLAQVARLDILAQAGKPDQGRMNILREAPMSDLSRWILAAAYASSGRKDVSNQLAEKAGVSVSTSRSLSQWLWSDVRDQAFILEAMVRVGDQTRSVVLARSVREQLRSARWLSTQETGSMLWAVSRWAASRGGAGNFQVRWRTGGGAWKTESGAQGSLSIEIPDQAKGALEVENLGKGALELLYTRIGIDPPGTPPAPATGLTLEIKYQDSRGVAVDPANLKKGQDFVIRATVTNTSGDYLDNLALVQVFPGGWELRNEAIEGAIPGKGGARHSEFRDDRVFHHFALGKGQNVTFQVGARASYTGTYLRPGAFVSAMYDGSIQAATASGTSVVAP